MKNAIILLSAILLFRISGFGQKPVFIQVIDDEHRLCDSFEVSAYVVTNNNFELRTIKNTDSAGIAKLYLSPDSNYKINANWIGTPHKFFYFPEVANMNHFTGDTFRLSVYRRFRRPPRMENVYFEYDRDVLIGFYKEKINETLPYLILNLKDNPTWTVILYGHSDNKGTDEYNKLISQKRADTVKRYLISKGISKNRITTKAMGASQPLAPYEKDGQDDPEGRARNRRVEFKIDTYTELNSAASATH